MDNPTAKVRIVDGVVSVEVDISAAPDPEVLVPLSPDDVGNDEANAPVNQVPRWVTLAGG